MFYFVASFVLFRTPLFATMLNRPIINQINTLGVPEVFSIGINKL